MSQVTPLDGPKQPAAESPVISRRGLLVGGAAAAGATLLGTLPSILPAQGSSTPTSGASEAPRRPIGEPTSAISSRSPFEQPARTPTGQVTGASFSPLQEFSGTITPTDLHFERHHSGVPIINPAQYALLVHGLVDRQPSSRWQTSSAFRRPPGSTFSSAPGMAGLPIALPSGS